MKAKTQHDLADPPEGKKVWLRLTRRKAEYEYASSADGKKWTVHGERAWSEKAPGKIGVLAKGTPCVRIEWQLGEGT